MTELVGVALGYDGHYPHQTLQTGATDVLSPVPLPLLIRSLVFCVISDEYSTKEEDNCYIPKYCKCISIKAHT